MKAENEKPKMDEEIKDLITAILEGSSRSHKFVGYVEYHGDLYAKLKRLITTDKLEH
jgi:hypothetical protein